MGGEWLPDTAGATTGDFCYAKQEISYTPEIKIGDTLVIHNLGDYVVKIYNYSFRFVGMIAIIMLMIGGLQYILARGGPGTGAAKTRIRNALFGFVLLLGAYIILQTISPQLIKLGLPRVKKIEPKKFQLADKFGQELKKDDKCYTIRDKDNCHGDSEMHCIPLATAKDIGKNAANCVTLLNTASTMFALAAGGGIFPGAAASAGSNIAQGVKTGAQLALRGGKALLGLAWKYKTTTAVTGAVALVGYEYVKEPPPDPAWGEEGVCMSLTEGTLPLNAICAADFNCMAGLKCVKVAEGCVEYGVCSDGSNGAGCKTAADCKNPQMHCVTLIEGTGACSDGQLGSYCKNNNDCIYEAPCKIDQASGVGTCSGGAGKCPSGQFQPSVAYSSYTLKLVDCLSQKFPGVDMNTCREQGTPGTKCYVNEGCLSGNCWCDSLGVPCNPKTNWNGNCPDLDKQLGTCKQ